MGFQNITLTLGFASLVCLAAQAEDFRSGLFIEPAVTYELGSATVDYPSPFSSSSGSSNGFGLGAKVGLHLSEAFFVALDARYSMPQYKDSSVTYDAPSVSTNWGPAVGIQIPDFGARVGGTLVLGGELNPEKSGSFDVAFRKATGYRVGAGFRVAAVSLNIEYQQLRYGESVLEQLGPFTSGSVFDSVRLENKSWIGSVSFPFEL